MASRESRAPSQETGRIDEAAGTFVGEGGFRSDTHATVANIRRVALRLLTRHSSEVAGPQVDDSQIKQPEQEEDKSPGLRRRQAISALASIAFHALIIAAIAYFVVPGARPRTQWLVIHLEAPGAGVASHGHSADGHPTIARLETGESPPAKTHHRDVTHHVASVRRHHPIRAAHKKRIARKQIAHRTKPRKPHVTLRASEKPRNPARKVAAAKLASLPGTKHPAVASSGADPADPMRTSGGMARDPHAPGASDALAFAGTPGRGGGWSDAHARYGENPAPHYPREARLLDEQGTVMLRVEIASDGSVTKVEVAHSSGFDLLDEAAVETVSDRWRFVPARRNGVAVQSWVRVPIRFALKEASADF